MQTTLCRLISVTDLTPVVKRVILEADSPLAFKPGQYCQLVLSEDDKRPFSIASMADGSDRFELHMGVPPGNDYVQQAFDYLTSASTITVEVGLGNAYLRDVAMPTLLIAGGTGFSYTWSILQSLLAKDTATPVFLYWGARELADMYAFDALTALDNQHSNFSFVPVVEQAPDHWAGRTGWVHKAAMQDFASFESYQVYVAGRFEMASAVRDDFQQQGLLPDNLFGDAFAFI